MELWEAKVKQGQLRRDSDLIRIANSLRQGMSTMVSGSGLTLEDIGITSVQDYGGTKDGTFKINETTLKEAIENNTEQVSKLFMQSAPSGVSEEEVYNQKGIMMRLKDILYDETVSSKSVLAKKVGFEGTTTVANNTLTKQMTEYQKKIDEMEDLFADKEQALYTKYSKLETIMNNYNSQMTYLSQALGLSTS
ncbi:flagellar filament capping protein FliD [Clostridium gallinarum]|uniref:flagellar filament capping protein FliD n=1 Tax=Clostridium gallinarum TaxID=2762246 RepID=UPI00311AA35C